MFQIIVDIVLVCGSLWLLLAGIFWVKKKMEGPERTK